MCGSEESVMPPPALPVAYRPVVTITAVIAVYAALVATSGLVWQIFVWRHGQRLRLTLTIHTGGHSQTSPDGTTEEWHEVFVSIVNPTDRDIRCTPWITGIDRRGRTCSYLASDLASQQITILAHGDWTTVVDAAKFFEMGLAKGDAIHAEARLPTGETFRSFDAWL
jgi:hypothetical protein